MSKFDKLKHFLRGEDDKPQPDVDMKKASLIRKNYPKYATWSIGAIKADPIWDKVNTNGIEKPKPR